MNKIVVYKIPLDKTDPQKAAILSAAERERMGRFVFAKDRDAFLASHVAMREILGDWLHMEAREIVYTKNAYGKLGIMPAQNPQNVQFNLTHSGKLGLLAVRYNHPIGVDVEWMRPLSDASAIVSSHFSPTEQEAYFAVPDVEKTQAFYNGWTRKEAFIKAHGLGLSFPLKQFSVELTPHKPAELLWVANEYDDGQLWTVAAIRAEEMPANYTAAIATVGNDWEIEVVFPEKENRRKHT